MLITRRNRRAAARAPREIAADVFCLGPRGRTQTNIYFVRSGPSWVLVDAGWASDAPRIQQAAEALFGPDARPTAILLTHDHPDHEGAALALARSWACPVYMHRDELPVAVRDFSWMLAHAMPLDRWVALPLMRAVGRTRREAVFARSTLREVAHAFPPESGVPGLPDWNCIPTPGHTPGHVSYFRPIDRVLVTGDAVVTLKMDSVTGPLKQRRCLSEPPWYTTWNQQVARQSIETLARLQPTVLAGGHGEPMSGTDTAHALDAFARLITDQRRL